MLLLLAGSACALDEGHAKPHVSSRAAEADDAPNNPDGRLCAPASTSNPLNTVSCTADACSDGACYYCPREYSCGGAPCGGTGTCTVEIGAASCTNDGWSCCSPYRFCCPHGYWAGGVECYESVYACLEDWSDCYQCFDTECDG